MARDVSTDHPAMMPVALAAQYIEACTDAGDVVYEPFGGSGTTLIACEQTGRACRLMEIAPGYLQGVIDRWEAETGRTAEPF